VGENLVYVTIEGIVYVTNSLVDEEGKLMAILAAEIYTNTTRCCTKKEPTPTGIA
jgi:hypothetical protein